MSRTLFTSGHIKSPKRIGLERAIETARDQHERYPYDHGAEADLFCAELALERFLARHGNGTANTT